MPGMDGWAVLREIRKRRPALPVIICSGHHAHEGETQALEAGAVGYVRKPFKLRELTSAVARALVAAGGVEPYSM